MTARASGADKGNQTVQSPRSGQEILRSIFRSIQCESVECESVERVHGVNPWLMRSMNRFCNDCWYLWYMQYVLRNLKQIDDILVPHVEEEIAEVSKSLDRVQQYPERLLW